MGYVFKRFHSIPIAVLKAQNVLKFTTKITTKEINYFHKQLMLPVNDHHSEYYRNVRRDGQ